MDGPTQSLTFGNPALPWPEGCEVERNGRKYKFVKAPRDNFYFAPVEMTVIVSSCEMKMEGVKSEADFKRLAEIRIQDFEQRLVKFITE